MGAYSTLLITRTKAKQLVLNKVFTMSDEELEKFCDLILEDRLYNCRIVGDHEKNDDEVV